MDRSGDPDSNAGVARTPQDERHHVLVVLLRTQFVASTIGVALSFVLFTAPENHGVFAACAVVLAILGAMAFAPMSYLRRARAYSAVFVALAVGLAVLSGPQAAMFLVMCGALILPLILLPSNEAYGYVALCFLLVGLTGWLHVTDTIGIRVPFEMHDPTSPVPWIGGLITILTISVPFSVLAQRLLSAHREAHDRSERLVDDLRLEVEERRAALDALQVAERRLTHAQKLELLGQLAGGLAHDMNNALTVIQGEASFLSDESSESRDIIVEHANHAAQLTRQLLMLGRKDVVQPKDVDFVDEVRRASKSVRKLLPSEITLTERFEVETATVHADPSQIAQIVLNLVVNARDAMVGGGDLSIRVDVPDDAPGFVDLEISDTGAGIPRESLSSIFEPFFSTKPEGAGTGLGLANVKELVDGLGGDIDVVSEVGAGTTMRVRLPTLDELPPMLDETSADAAGQRVRGDILLVDDNDSVRRITRSILEGDGHRVLEASSAVDAISVLSGGADADLVITDVVMPDGGGKDVIDWVRESRPSTKLLVISGYAEDDRVRRGLRAGELPFLRKPYSASELLAEAQRLLRNGDAN